MQWIKLVLVFAVVGVFSGCTFERLKPEAEEPEPVGINYVDLQNKLEIYPKKGRVGYQEKVFDACEFSPMLPHLKDCHHAYFIDAVLQLSCRASDDSNSVLSSAQLEPLMNKPLKWLAGANHGEVQTDISGFLEIRAISAFSMKRQQLKVSTEKDFLVMRAGQSTNIVTPPSWCE